MNAVKELKNSSDRMLLLYRKLLKLTVDEQAAINDNDLEKIEKYCSSKESIVIEMETLKKAGMPDMSPGDAAEIRVLIKKILDINNANKESVHGMKDKLMEDIQGFKKRKTAIKAYNRLP